MHDVDVFVFYDTAQYTKNDWRNRNRIKTPHGPKWLTVPVGPNLNRRICDVEIANDLWQRKHWKTILQCYSKARHFAMYREFFELVYLGKKWRSLSELNQYLIKNIAHRFLGIETAFANAPIYVDSGDKSDRLISILRTLDAEIYVSGPAARNYLDETSFAREKIAIVYKSYDGYPLYEQLFPPFDPFVSIIDVLFHLGSRASDFIWGWRR